MNGYVTINIAGNEVGLKFAYPAIRWFAEASKDKQDAFFMPGETGDFSVEGLAKLIECSYRNNCLIKEVEPVLKYEAFYNWVEERQDTGQDDLLRIITAYAESSVMKKLVKANEEKKSLTETEVSTSTISSQPATENLELNLGNSTE